MSWYTGREAGIEKYDEFQKGPNECFFCRRRLSMPRVAWNGAAGPDGNLTIALHPKCAVRLSQHLGKDALAAENGFLFPGYSVDPRLASECRDLRRELEYWKGIVLQGRLHEMGYADPSQVSGETGDRS
jgi:hypothetical protein